MTVAARQPHAVLDLPSRRLKGLKIERLLHLAERRQPIRMLESGIGSGGMARALDVPASDLGLSMNGPVTSSRR